MSWERLSTTERKALINLRDKAVDKRWLTFDDISVFDKARSSVTLSTNISRVERLLAKALRPGKSFVSAVKFADGKLEEISTAALPAEKLEELTKEKDAKAVTVAKPGLGCPLPNFSAAELKARQVLSDFLLPEQMEDFEEYQRFVSVGAATGHKYMVTSRHAPKQLSLFGGRQLFDLDERTSFCIHHDEYLPAAEEMLTLHVMLQFPEHEMYLRSHGGIGEAVPKIAAYY